MPKISVIIPIYNVEKYLRRCLDSVLNQTFTDWQAICVNDGSPDNSDKILDEYAKKDSRFKVIHKDNQGVSRARNVGIENAEGEFIHFLDADDWIDADFYAHAIAVANDTQADMVVVGFVSDNKYTKPIVYKTVKVLRTIKQKVLGTFALTDSYVWRYLFNTDFVRKNNMMFDTNLIAQEDTLFVLNAIEKSNAIAVVPWVNYHYMFNENSALNSRNEEHHKKVKQQYKIGKKYRVDFAKKHNLILIWKLRKFINLFR